MGVFNEVLDGLTDAANVGTLLRLGVAFGVSAVVYSPDCCDPYHERSVGASALKVLQQKSILLHANQIASSRVVGIGGEHKGE
eukprot:4604060-Amphidinium_carterae.1